MAPSNSLIAESLQLVALRLQRLGFAGSSGVYTIPVDDQIDGWVGLNEARDRGDCFELNPFVGVVHHALERKVAELTGRTSSEPSPSVTSHLAYLLPGSAGRSKPWRFCKSEDLAGEADSLTRAVADYALPFMRELSAPDRLAQAIRDLSFEEARAERLPVIYWLAGDKERAREVLQDEVARVETDPSEAGAQFRGFAKRFERELS